MGAPCITRTLDATGKVAKFATFLAAAAAAPAAASAEPATTYADRQMAAYGVKPWRWTTDVLRDALAHLHAAGTHPEEAARIARELDERGAVPARVPAYLLLRLACPALPGRC